MNKFRTIIADPPWRFGDSLPGRGRGALSHYKLMKVDQIARHMLPGLYDDSRLFLWRVASMQEEALFVMKAWGFTLKSEIVWNKITKNGKKHFGMGRQVRASHEVCLIGVRGRPETLSKSVRSTFEAKVGVHSKKPDEFYSIVKELSPSPIVELFARRGYPGITVMGDEV